MSGEDQHLLTRDDSINLELNELDEAKLSAEEKQDKNNNFLQIVQSVVPQLMANSPDVINFLRIQTTPYFKMTAHFVEQEKQIKRLNSQLEDEKEKGKTTDKKLQKAVESEKELLKTNTELTASSKAAIAELKKAKQENIRILSANKQLNTEIEKLNTALTDKNLECESNKENLNKLHESNIERQKEIGRLNNDIVERQKEIGGLNDDIGVISAFLSAIKAEDEEQVKKRTLIKANEERIALDLSSSEQMKQHVDSRYGEGLQQSLINLENYMKLKPEEKGEKHTVEMNKTIANSKRIAEWGSTHCQTTKKVRAEKDISNDRKWTLEAFKSAPAGWLNKKIPTPKK